MVAIATNIKKSNVDFQIYNINSMNKNDIKSIYQICTKNI